MSGGSGGLIGFFTRHPNAANLLMALLLALGVFALLGLTTRFWPPTELNQVEISISWPGASAEDVSSNVLGAVEPAVRYLPNVDTVRSTAREGSAFTTIQFDAGTDMPNALRDVEQAVKAITTLPEEAETPRISFDALRDPVAKIGVSGPFSEQTLQVFARRIRDDLLARGLDRVSLNGAREREILVEAREHDLLRHAMTVDDLAKAIRANTLDRPSGTLDGIVNQQVRVMAGDETPESIAAIPVKTLASGDRLRVGDVASVTTGFARGAVTGLRDGNPAIELVVQRAQTADALRTDRLVRDYLAEARARLPQSLDLKLYDVRTERLDDRIGILVRNGWQGLAIVLVVLFVFLDARIAVWVALGIPVAFAGTLAVMLASGQTINMISLFALIMMLGVIVDDAIVVGEHADTLSARGLPPAEAAMRGASDMFVPVLASSVTTIAALAPILLMRDVMGQMMEALPLVGIAIIVASLVECFLILPGHLAHAGQVPGALRFGRFLRLTVIAGVGAAFIGGVIRASSWLVAQSDGGPSAAAGAVADLPAAFLAVVAILSGLGLAGLVERRLVHRHAGRRNGPLQRFRTAFDKGFAALRDGVFTRFVRATVDFRYTTAAVAVGSVMVVVYGLYLGGGHVRFIFFPSPEAESVSARLTFQPGTPRETVIKGVEAADAALQRTAGRLADADETLVSDVYALLGRAGRDRGDNLATLSVQLTPTEARSVRTPALVRAWSDDVPDIPGLQRISLKSQRGGPPGRDVDLKLTGAEPAVLKKAATDVMAALDDMTGISGVRDDLPYGKPEVAMRLTPRGEALGFTLESVGRQVRGAFEGQIARRLAIGAEDVPIRVRQTTAEEGAPVSDLFLRSPQGVFVPITEVVSISERNTFSVILRRDGVTTVAVLADVDPAVTTPQAVTETIRSTVLPQVEARYGVRGEFAGRDRERRRSFEDLRRGAYLAGVVIYLTLALVFGCYWRPLAIMLIIPFGAVGAVLGHFVLGMSLTIVSFVGLLGLAGILVNDSIILVRRLDERLSEGDTLRDAAVGASADRLRAVLLTSLTTIGGLVPLLFETSLAAQFLLPMAVTIVFGLAVATAIVLVLVPTLIMIGADIGRIVGVLIGRRDLDAATP